MATSPSLTHLLAHTARMTAILADTPDHPRAGEYAAQLAEYRGAWAKLSPADRADTRAVAESADDLTDARLDAAVAILEG